MMSDNMSENVVMDLDLNQEPLDPPPSSLLGLGSLLNDLETTHSRIEDRIRQLEAVTARARQRQRWRQSRNPNSTESIDLSVEPIVNLQIVNGVTEGEDNVEFPQESNTIVQRGIGYKRDSSHLVAKALELDTEVKKAAASNSGGSFYDCNICLEIAKDPILTCCGHLYCWACFYQVSSIDSSSKECPVCKGEVTDSSITPIYGGNCNDTRISESELGLKIPPRPKANRIESVRRMMQNGAFSHIPVAEALRRIRNMGVSGGAPATEPPEVEAGGSHRRFRSRQFSRVLSESAASLSSISSALNNAERLVEDLETYIHDRIYRRNDVARFRNTSAAQGSSGSLTVDSTSEVNSAAIPPLVSSRRSDLAAEILHLENVASTAAATSADMVAARTSRRRSSDVSRVSDADNEVEVAREPRRRRLR